MPQPPMTPDECRTLDLCALHEHYTRQRKVALRLLGITEADLRRLRKPLGLATRRARKAEKLRRLEAAQRAMREHVSGLLQRNDGITP